MLMKKLPTAKAAIFVLLLLTALAGPASAQVTTATLSGIVKDPKGEALAGVSVTVEYPDAGISQKLVTKSDGRFTVPNLRVGGPYKVSVTM